MTKWYALPTALLLALGGPSLADDAGDALYVEEEKPVQAEAPAEMIVVVESTIVAQAEDASTDEPPAEDEAEPTPEELEAQLRELNRELQAAQNRLQQMNARRNPRVAPGQGVDHIILPEDPTREDCEQYIEALAQATQGQNSFSSNDPQVVKLKQIPAEHIDLLVSETTGRSPLRYHANYAMREMDFGTLREQIDSLLRRQPAMIGIVVNRGWATDAHEAIAEKLNQRQANLGIAWFQAASELNDPSLHDALHDCALQTRYFSQVITILECIPDYDIERTVSVLWERQQDASSGSNKYQVAVVAVRYGHVDALEEISSQVSRRGSYYNNNGENTFDQQRAVLMRYIDFSGTNAEIAQWLAEHKDELIFDHVTQRYLLPEQLESF